MNLNQQDPFTQFKLNVKETPTQTKIEETLTENPFEEFKLQNKSQDQSFLSELPRHSARTISRIGEQIGGFPGDARNFLNSVINPVIEPLMENVFGKDVTQKSKEMQEKFRILPTSKELKEKSEEATSGFTKSKNPTEELFDEYTETVTNLLGPTKFRKALAVGALGTGLRKGMELFGFEEGPQQAAKFGTMIISSMFNPQGIKNFYRNHYNEALKHLPENTLVSAKPLEMKLTKLEQDLSKGTLAPSEKLVLDEIQKVKSKIKDGKVDVGEMVASYRSINERRGDPEFLKRAENLLNPLQKAVDGAIKLYQNPDFVKNYRAAQQAYGGLYQSQKLSRWLNNLLGGKPFSKTLATIGIELVGGHPEYIPGTLASAGAILGGVKSYELLNRITTNPTLRKYYIDMLSNAAKENSRGALKAANQLEKHLERG